MPQKTNLNVGPYYDDFDKDNNFYRVLFKPGFPVQARELTTSQSILQNQIESLGGSFYKEGSVVIPGNAVYDSKYFSIKLNSTHLGVDVSLYIDKLVGKKIKGETTGIVAIVDKYSKISESEGITHLTLFVKYLESGSDNKISFFNDGEILILEENETGFTYLNTIVNPGETIATLVENETACFTGSSAQIEPGVYFIRGTFVDVAADKIVLDPYTNLSSYRVGLSINEELIAAKDDPSLYDNAKGFSNFAAPGADRLKIYTKLTKKSLDDYNDISFIELFKVKNGELVKLNPKKQDDPIKDYLAARTFDESGHYSVKDYDIEIKESLNNNEGNGGLYLSSQKTSQDNTPSDDLMCIKFGPGKAYVKGYDIEKTSSTIIDVSKPRDKTVVSSALVPFEFGSLVKVNNVSGVPFVGLSTSGSIKLFNQRKGVTGSGTTYIGDARVYAFNLSDAPYSNNASEWDLYLFDVQTYTVLELNQSLTAAECPSTSYIKGLNSGASGYTTVNASSSILTLNSTSGSFTIGEQISISGITTISRTIKNISVYGAQDVKSVYQQTTGYPTFTADTNLYEKIAPKFNATDQIFINNSGIATSPGKFFAGIKTDTIISYQVVGQSVPNYNKVVSVSATGETMQLAATATVSGICNGALPDSSYSGTFKIASPLLQDKGGLYAKLGSSNVSTVNLGSSTLKILKQITGESTTAGTIGTMTVDISQTGISSAFFDTFDAERYSVIYSNGTVAPLSSEQFTLSNNGSTLNITGLTGSQSDVILNATLTKQAIKEKQKQYVRCQNFVIDKTSSVSDTSGSGLTFNQYYGTRVQDKEICLNVPDVAKIIAIYESLGTTEPTADTFFDSITVPTGLSLGTNSIIGEKIFGADSGAIAKIVKTPTTDANTKVLIVYLNSNKFIIGENITFEESNIETIVVTSNKGVYQNIASHFVLDKGQKDQYYDYSKIVRIKDDYIPSHKILVIYDHYVVPTNDTGDVYTVNSYPSSQFKEFIPVLPDATKVSDTLDFRPRVVPITTTTPTSSPFAFSSRNFLTEGSSPPLVPAPLESSVLGYEYYLPRIDKLCLDKSGTFTVVKGVSALDPKPPAGIEDAMELAQLTMPAYLYNVSDVKVTLIDNKRYTMRDIGKIDDRVKKLESLSSLSLLELDTKTLQVKDAEGFDKFKTGFFVDDFQDQAKMDPQTTAEIIDIPDDGSNLNTLK